MAAHLLVPLAPPSYGITFNRAVEDSSAHQNYFRAYHPRRSRLTYALIFEEFEQNLEQYVDLEEEWNESTPTLIQTAASSSPSLPEARPDSNKYPIHTAHKIVANQECPPPSISYSRRTPSSRTR